jgi:hypothetical protein
VRDEFSADVIGLPGVQIVPCPATLLRPLARDFVSSMAGFEFLKRFEPREYIVIHATGELERLAGGLRRPIVAVDPQPWARRAWKVPCPSAPPTHSPEVLLTIVAGAEAVVTRSLHLAIFALTAGVPFCIVDGRGDPQTLKLRRYFARAGLSAAVYSGNDPVAHALELAGEIENVRTAEVRRASESLDAIAAALLGR